MRHSASVFRWFQSLLLDLFAAVHGQRRHGVRGQNHNGAPHKIRGGSSRDHTHRPAGINRVWADGLHVLSDGDEKSSSTADWWDQCMDARVDLFIRARLSPKTRQIPFGKHQTASTGGEIDAHAWTGRGEDLNPLSSLELAERHVGKQICHLTCETHSLLWRFITQVRSCRNRA